jgi:REP element-mobilizing transposase RayT
MTRRARQVLPEFGWWHATCRGVDGVAIYRDANDRLAFLSLVATAVHMDRWTCEAVCLMGNHYHLILHARRADLSAGLGWVNGVYAQRFNRRYARRGHLFGDRFASWIVDTEEHLARAIRYVLLNPVRAGLCEHAADWRWSAAAPRWRSVASA